MIRPVVCIVIGCTLPFGDGIVIHDEPGRHVHESAVGARPLRPVVPIPDDPERDARRAAYRARERARAIAALDRFLDYAYGPALDMLPNPLQQKAHYGVPAPADVVDDGPHYRPVADLVLE